MGGISKSESPGFGDSTHAGDEAVMGARQDGVGGRAESEELGLGHIGVRSWDRSSDDCNSCPQSL